ncbi:MAG: UvrD-helicase domain-containing protein, partial [Bacteroidales bacterium]|nr:UvrD-helicase domain-containing protein [Bacteroidales bacterium]
MVSNLEKEFDADRGSEYPDQQGPGKSFLDSIEGLAARLKAGSSGAIAPAKSDLADFSSDDFPEIETTDKTARKITELQSIIASIESRPQIQHEITLDRNYRINYKGELNRAQLEAVTSINGPVLVIAGAGSGKTRVIVYRVAFMMENGINPEDMLLLTFTRKAAGEMLGRVQQLLKDNSAQKVFGGTFHAFANFVLRKYSNLINIPPDFTIIDEEDSADTIDLIRSELKTEKTEKAFPRKNRIQEIISSARN